MADIERTGYMSLSTYDGICRAINEKLDETVHYTATELEEKIRSIGTRDTLDEYLRGELFDYTYHGVFLRSQVFNGDNSIKSFTAPMLASISASAFLNSQLQSIKCENVTTCAGMSAFDGCKQLTEVYFPRVQIFSGQYLMRSCLALVTLELPEALEVGGAACLSNCTSLKSLIIPKCKKIVTNNNWLSGSTSLIEIIIESPDCTLSSSSGFPSNFLEIGTIYIKDEYAESYKTKTNWSYFADIIKPLSERPTEVTE